MSLLRRFASWLLAHAEDMLGQWTCEHCDAINPGRAVHCEHCNLTPANRPEEWGTPEDIHLLFLEEFPPGDPADLPY